jgi:Protein of unknown function (DUF1592)/Protein of unknown function (DUF1588)/Protein of unknown function (DUF1587)
MTDRNNSHGSKCRAKSKSGCVLPLAACLLLACNGSFGSMGGAVPGQTPGAGPGAGGTMPPGSGGPILTPAECATKSVPLGDSRLLTRQELLNTVDAAFAPIALNAGIAFQDLPEDSVETGFPNNVGAAVSSSFHQSKLIDVAELVADKVSTSFSTLQIDCSDDAACISKLVERAGKRLLRRQLTVDEVKRYADAALAAGTTREQKIRFATMALVLSPDAVYELHRTNLADEAQKKTSRRYQLASRLSFMLWQAGPDEGLLANAEGGALDSDTGRIETVKNMMATPRFQKRFSGFVRDWLQLDYGSWEKSAKYKLTDDFKAEALRDVDRFTSNLIGKEGSFQDLLTDTTAYVTPQLAQIYGTDIVSTKPASADGLSEVTLSAEHRAGILTRVAFLTSNNHSSKISPTVLGKALANRVVCATVQDPPPEIQNMFPQLPDDPTKSTRQILTETTSMSAQCQSCHRVVDPLGLSFSQYDVVGSFRLKEENGITIDAATTGGILGDLRNGVDFSHKAAVNADVHACFSNGLFRSAIARSILAEDQCVVAPIAAGLADPKRSLKQGFVEIAARLENP